MERRFGLVELTLLDWHFHPGMNHLAFHPGFPVSNLLVPLHSIHSVNDIFAKMVVECWAAIATLMNLPMRHCALVAEGL